MKENEAIETLISIRRVSGYSKIREEALDMAIAALEKPKVDAAEIRHGQWKQNDNGTWSCSECSSWIPDEQHYYARFCLHCGAKMDGGTNK